MHGNNRAIFLLRQTEYESTTSRARANMCLALSIAPIGYKYAVPARLWVPTNLLSSLQFLTRLMSHTRHTSTSPNIQLIFDNALNAYKECTNNDLLTHPLAERFEACDSASSILTVLQEQVQELNGSQRNDTKWLDPIVNVLHAFSETLGEGVGSVCFRTS